MDIGNLFSLSGRIGRKDYIFLWLGILGMGLIVSALSGFESPPQFVAIAESIIAAVIMIPAGFKRLHDTGKSGWWLLIGLVPFFGWIVMFVLTWIIGGDEGVNTYGVPNSGSPFPSLHA